MNTTLAMKRQNKSRDYEIFYRVANHYVKIAQPTAKRMKYLYRDYVLYTINLILPLIAIDIIKTQCQP